MNKKPRISHLASKAATAPVNGKLSSSNGKGEAGGAQAGVAVSMSDGGMTSSFQQLPVLDIPRPFEALSDVSNDSSHNGRDCDSQETAASERLSQPPSLFSGSTMLTAPSIATSSPGHTVLEGPQEKSPPPSCNNKSRKKSKKHKDKEKSKYREKEKGRAQVKERKSREGFVPEPNRASELSPGNLKSNSIPHKSTGESDSRAQNVLVTKFRFLNKSITSFVDGYQLVITVSRCCIMWPECDSWIQRYGDTCCSA